MTVPSELNDLVSASLSPGATIVGSNFNSSRLTFDFTIQWRGRSHGLSITREQWDDRRFEIIQLLSRLAVPYPEATRAGQRLWISYHDNLVSVQGDFTTWPFFIQSDLDGSAFQVDVPITGTAHALLDNKADQSRHDQRAFRIAAAIWQLKTHTDTQGGIGQSEATRIDSYALHSLLNPSRATDQQVREYAAIKLHQAYKGSDISVQLEFNWTDFMYLGVTKEDFLRAIRLREDADWSSRDSILKPTVALVERLDKAEAAHATTRSSTRPTKQAQGITGKYGKWEIVRSLTEGGQAHTFLVKNSADSGDSVLYVLKRLKNRERLARFKREIETGLRLVHPNLVRVIDFDIEGQRPYLVCEYCEGGDLRSKGVEQGFGVLCGLRFFRPICEGVAHAHKHGVVHRDLNPKNIFLAGRDNRLVVGDFGICFVDEQGERLTMTEEAVGPRLYIAPELEDGRIAQVSQRSDVYSLGKLLYWLITGTEFAREKHRLEEFNLTRRFNDPCIEHVNRLLDRMVATDPSDRFPSAVELLSELEETTTMLEKGFNVVDRNVEQRCIYCGKGSYKLVVNGSPETGYGQIESFGLTPRGRQLIWKIFVCDHCGNMQLFRPDQAKNPKIWE